MDDLSGLTWSSSPQASSAKPTPQIPPLRPTPSPSLSRTGTPVSALQSGSNARVTSSSSAAARTGTHNDSFANLLGPQPVKGANGVSLQERQKQLLAEKARQAEAQTGGYHDQYRTNDNSFWEGLGSGRGTPNPVEEAKRTAPVDDDDILSAFNASAPVDAASHFPPPHSTATASTTDSHQTSLSNGHSGGIYTSSAISEDDDDPFGLGSLSQKPIQKHQRPALDNEDDILGELGKPAPEVLAQRESQRDSKGQMSGTRFSEATPHPSDAALAELVDMGFPLEKSQQALASTKSGSDVQGAVSWLLNQAHQDSRKKPRDQSHRNHSPQNRAGKPQPIDSRRAQDGLNQSTPAWAKKRSDSGQESAQTPASADIAQAATEFGNNLFKSANTLWKTGQKKMQKAVADFQHEGETGTPRWMREPEDPQHVSRSDAEKPNNTAKPVPNSSQTNEAMLLDEGRRPSTQRSAPKPVSRARRRSSDTRPPESSTRKAEPSFSSRPTARPQLGDDRSSSRPTRPMERVSRQAVEAQSSQAYISPARRKKQPIPQPSTAESSAASLDIFSNEPTTHSTDNSAKPKNPSPRPDTMSRSPAPLPIRPKAIPRQAPDVTPSVLSTSTSDRHKGSEAFKRGDYGEAQSCYSKALRPLPPGHPLTIVLLCNRALTCIKVGEPKLAITDADTALKNIGPSRGEGELIALGTEEGSKPMNEFYGKALMRKAEALEHMEKWPEAAKIWRDAVEAGVGGSISIQGRNRCEKASGQTAQTHRPSSIPAVKKQAPKKLVSAPKPSALQELGGGSGPESTAVRRLREANAAAATASDEAFALNDSVEARLIAWKNGKSDNLRALLASLDTVLWPDAGWKKVGMSDLVLPPKVKIVYMKAIAKVHPDKISQQATTEQRMISAAVFAILNEAWDKFKKDNGL
ncbi:MAG: hypothetical protein M1828_005055 [Chrysothrix sp. TS-e1954]|nr:MAG: hypothetical protein M1828_005055 [Chrysothrix sp. TS-e1954]